MRYFLSFVGEAVMNPKYADYIGGRLEVYGAKTDNEIEEVRYFTKDRQGFMDFADIWDFKEVTASQLNEIKKIIKTRYYDNVA